MSPQDVDAAETGTKGTPAEELASRERQLQEREANFRSAKQQLVDREASVASAEEQIKTAKEQLQQQVKEKQQMLQTKADEIHIREKQFEKRQNAVSSTAMEKAATAALEAELEKVRLENFDLASASEKAEGLRRESERLKDKPKALETGSVVEQGPEAAEDAAKLRDAVANHDVGPFVEAKRLKLELEEKGREHEKTVEILNVVTKERDLLKSQIDAQRQNDTQIARGGSSTISAFDHNTHVRLGGALSREFRKMERLK